MQVRCVKTLAVKIRRVYANGWRIVRFKCTYGKYGFFGKGIIY